MINQTEDKLAIYPVHPDSNNVIEKIVDNSKKTENDVLNQLLIELRYNPYIGSELDTVKKRFLKNISKLNMSGFEK